VRSVFVFLRDTTEAEVAGYLGRGAMPNFRCACGASFRDEAEGDAGLVAYPLPLLGAAESRIAEAICAFLAAGESRTAWIASHFGAGYPAEESDRGIIEDIVSRELNAGFTAMFRCPSCNRVALCDPESNAWAFFRPEQEEAGG
jgi:hypothetical protein